VENLTLKYSVGEPDYKSICKLTDDIIIADLLGTFLSGQAKRRASETAANGFDAT
jgi:hypothetical protein